MIRVARTQCGHVIDFGVPITRCCSIDANYQYNQRVGRSTLL